MNDVQIVIKDWIKYLKEYKGYSSSTCNAYLSDLKHFCTFLEHYHEKPVDMSELSSVDVRTFRSWLTKRKTDTYNNRSNARALASIKNFYRYLSKNYGINNHILSVVKSPKVPKLLPKALDVNDTLLCASEIVKLHSLAWVKARDQALLYLIYGQGLRISEALSITKVHVADFSLKILGKGNKERLIPWVDLSKKLIQNYLDIVPYHIDNLSPIFVGVRGKPLKPAVFGRIIIALRRKLNLPENISAHSFRHSFASHLLSEGADLRSIQELLGHESLASTQIYTKINSTQLLKVYNSAHPLAKNSNSKYNMEEFIE